MECPRCHSDNREDSRFCRNCAAPLEGVVSGQPSLTKTLGTPARFPRPGSLISGKYRIIEEIGRGGMGIVYKAEDLKLQRRVALKFLPPDLAPIEEIHQRFRREAQAAAALDHPHICTVYEFDESDGKPFISMAYVEGQSLKTRIESRRLEFGEVLTIATQIAEGLREAHGKGVVHRDIKSANIMINEQGQAKIMDFGLARVKGSALVTQQGLTMGTISYMSPEQARGDEVDPRSDIWSFGVVLYEMLTGQLPFKGGGDQAVVYAILNLPPRPVGELRPEVPSGLATVVERALEKDLGDRYQNVEEMLTDLKAVAEGAMPAGPIARRRKAPGLKRKKGLLYGLAGALTIAAVVTAVLLSRRPEALDSVAVLPLENRSGDPGQDYFVEGMHEELITELSKIGALKVTSRPSVVRYRGVKKPLPEIARELNVKGIVAGSALKVGGRVRISVQLIDVRTERNLWAETYDRDYRDVLTLHGEVALEIARKIKIAVTPAEQRGLASVRPVNSEAQDLYLKGRYYWNKFSPELMAKTISFYEQSIEKDPDYALAYAGLAETYVMLSVGFAVLPGQDILPKARDAASKALALDPTLAEAHVSLGIVATCYDWDRRAAREHFDRALALNPRSVSVHQWIEPYLTFLEGAYQESLDHLARAQELDPLNLFVKTRLGFVDYYRRDYDGAIKRFKEIVDFDPNIPAAHLGLRECYFGKGLVDAAIAEGEKVLKLGMRAEAAVGGLACLYGKAGRTSEARALLAELMARAARGYVSSFWVAAVHMGLGETDEAFAWLDKAFAERDGSMIYITVPIMYDALGADPRYRQLLGKMGIGDLFEKLSPDKK